MTGTLAVYPGSETFNINIPRPLLAAGLLGALALPAAPPEEVTGTFLGWSGGTGLAVYLIEVDQVTKRYLWVREESKSVKDLRPHPGTQLRFAAVPVGKGRRYAEHLVLDGVLDAILQFEPPPPAWQAVGRAMIEILRSTAQGNYRSAARRVVKSTSVDDEWQRVCSALPSDPDPFLHQRGDSWAFTSVGPRQCRAIPNPVSFLKQAEFSLTFELTGVDGPRVTAVRPLPKGEHLQLFSPEP